MKILVTGRAIPQQPDRSTGQQLVQGLKEAGHEAYFYGCFYGQPTNFLGAKECQEVDNWDLVVITEMNDGMPGYEMLFEYHKLVNVPKLYWDFDVSYHPEPSILRARRYEPDGYLVGNKYFLGKEAFGRLGKPVLHLPYACSPTIHKKNRDQKKEYLLGFVGSQTGERQRLIEHAKANSYNSAWIHNIDGVFGDALVEQTNKYSVMFHNNQEACHGLVPGRPWESAGCGTTLLMDKTSYEDFIEFLPEHLHENVFMYENDNDIVAWLAKWGDKWSTLELYGDKLMTYLHENHSYKNRAERIIEWAKEQKIL